MPLTPQRTEINGHAYETVPLSFARAFDLKVELVEVLSEPLGDAAGAIFGDDISLDPEAEVDMDSVKRALVSAPRAIARHGGSKLVSKILAHTTWLKLEGDREVRLALSNDKVLSELFAGGNWGELYKLLYYVLQVNYFGPFDPTDTFAELWRKAQSWLETRENQQTSAPSEPTENPA